MIKLLIYLVIFYISYRLIKRVLGGKPEIRIPQGPGGLHREDMVLDPSCNTYISREKALSVKAGGKVHYFCSEECRSEFNKRISD